MKHIRREDIEHWAQTTEAKTELPHWVEKLVRATTPYSTYAFFPSGSATYVGGWDGIVRCEEQRSFVPKGTSLWEFGTEKGAKGKVKRDFDKRSTNPQGFEPSQSTVVVVTPRFWKGKEKWAEDKKKEGVWEDVRAYDSRDLESWFELASAVSMQYASHPSIGRFPPNGLLPAELFWEEWAAGRKGGMKLPPQIVTAGREIEMQQLVAFLSKEADMLGIRASSKSEAIAFIIAAAMQFESPHKETFFSKSLVVDNVLSYRAVRINNNALNLIPEFEDQSKMYAAVEKSHHVLIPLGPDDNFNQNTISLPVLDGDLQTAALVSMGLSTEDAREYSLKSGRNVTVLKRLLNFPVNRSKWIETRNHREIIPAMLIGRWNENRIGDRKLLEKLSGQSYDSYIQVLSTWIEEEDSPILQIGETWRLTSVLDTWTNVYPSLLKSDIHLLRECFLAAFQNGNPPIEDPSAPSFFTKEKTYSGWAREGLAQSLIFVSNYGDRLLGSLLPDAQYWVDSTISELLSNANGQLWKSLDNEMPLIAEASPDEFLSAVNTSVESEERAVIDIFEEKDGLISPLTNYTGMLWALESLAWTADYFSDATILLASLTTLDPGGRLSNRPLNSLKEIFKPWHYQTLADFDARIDTLKRIVVKEPDTGWKLSIGLLPHSSEVAHGTHKLRWRLFEKNTTLQYSWPETWATHTSVVYILLSCFELTDDHVSTLLEESIFMAETDRASVLDRIEDYSKTAKTTSVTWATLRSILNRVKPRSGEKNLINDIEYERYSELYKQLTPNDVIEQNLWLFETNWPQLLDAEFLAASKTDEVRSDLIEKKRLTALAQIITVRGLEKVIELSKTVKAPGVLGSVLGLIINNDKDTLLVLKILNDTGTNLNFIHGFIYRIMLERGVKTVFELANRLKDDGVSPAIIAHLFIPLQQSNDLWDEIERMDVGVKDAYWSQVRPHFNAITDQGSKIRGLQYLLSYGRHVTAIDEASYNIENVPSELIAEILLKTLTQPLLEQARIEDYHISVLFKALDERSDISSDILVRLEWLYLPILSSYGSNRRPILLYNELAKNPRFFVEVLSLMYKSDKRTAGLLDNEIREDRQERIRNAFELLYRWDKVPGTDDSGKVDAETLKNWVVEVRRLAKEVGRLRPADSEIGKILAQYPENQKGEWPPLPIATLIEEINSDSMKNGFSTALVNKRGSTSRGVFDGGGIERGHADYFSKLSEFHKLKRPRLSKIFSNLSRRYIEDAKREDEQALRDRLDY